MTNIAVIQTGGKQYVVKPESKLRVESLKNEKSGNLKLDTLLISSADGKSFKLGTPLLKANQVEAKVVGHYRAKKIRVVHYKAKTRQHKVYGHRQPYSQIQITKLG